MEATKTSFMDWVNHLIRFLASNILMVGAVLVTLGIIYVALDSLRRAARRRQTRAKQVAARHETLSVIAAHTPEAQDVDEHRH